MQAVSHYARHAMSVLGAFALTAALFVGSFSVDPQVTSVVGMIA